MGEEMARGRAVPIEESNVLIAFALRFDGYKYHEEHAFSPPVSDAPALSAAIEGMSVPERMATFFLLQRYLFKWGGEYLPMHGTAWQTFRRLFLMTCHEEVPEGYRPRGEYDAWAETWAGAIVKAEAVVRGVHESTVYDPIARIVI
jgi:hypothetical protein